MFRYFAGVATVCFVTRESALITRTSMIDVGAAYRDLRARISMISRGLNAEQWERVVPHCPAWTVRQTLAHLSGIVDDAINGNMTGVATDEWTDAQVAKRATMAGPEIMDEWQTYGPFVDARASEAGLSLGQLLFDAVNHEHDLRYALGEPGARDSDALWVALHFVCTHMNPRLAGHGLAGLAIVVGGTRMTPSASVEVHGSLFDIVRASASRRSLTQVQQMHWVGDASQHFDKLYPFSPPECDINE